MEAFGEDIWIASGPTIESAGFRYPTRMAVIRLLDDSLFVWSPVALSPTLRAEVDALGAVRFLVTPTAMHSASLLEWKAAYPDAALFAAPGSRKRRKDIAFDDDLTTEPPPSWRSQIEQVLVEGNAIATEVVFFHRKSGVILFADLLQNFPKHWFTGLQSLIARTRRHDRARAKNPSKIPDRVLRSQSRAKEPSTHLGVAGGQSADGARRSS